jgi:DNA-directed DNA polymerase III PolC
MSIEQLVQKAKDKNHDCIALTDINCMTGVYDFVLECGKQGIKSVLGIEFRNGDELLYVTLARNAAGFKELNEFLSHRNINKTQFPKQAPLFENSYVIYPFNSIPKTLRENEYIGIQTEDINQLFSQRYKTIIKKCVILHPVTIASRFEYDLHLCLRAMDHNVVMDKLQPHQYGKLQHHIPPIDKLLSKYERFTSVAYNTLNILDDCCFEFDFNTVKNKKHYTASRYEDKELLTQLALKGMEERYGKTSDQTDGKDNTEANSEAKNRIAKELEVIHNMGFSAHFLITWDITQYSSRQGFCHVGRGSGANSIVAYCIGITDVDPIELNLFFERFLNPHRSSPPDFDIDWSHKTRDHILDYIFDRFGKEHTCHVGSVNTFQNRSPIRELGKVFGLPKEEIDMLVKNRRRNKQSSQQASTLSEMLKDEICQKIEKYCHVLQNKPNHLSMHSCGILITEEPITQYTALELPPKGYNTAQIDMYICEDIGLEKLDVLSQRGLSSIETCLQTIESNQGENRGETERVRTNIHQIQKLKNDPELNDKLSRGNTIGCFYIESPAMRGLLRRLKCDNYITLVAASSIIRPGVAKSGMMREYVARHNKVREVHYPHPIFKEQLEETYGVMVYQEDVIKIAHFFGGLSLADADVLRRAMSGKVRDNKQFEQVKINFINNCKSFGYSMDMVAEVYRQIESFAGFSFCKAHSASYSVESYQSLYLKTHYPLEFIVGVINNFGGFYRTEVYIHEAKMSGANVCLPCVNHSDYLTNINGKDIHLGFIHVERIDKTLKELIPNERTRNGDYLSLEDFILRTNVSYTSLKQLLYLGAFRFTGQTKAELLVNARILTRNETNSANPTLFQTKTKSYKLPELQRSIVEDAYDEIDVLGFPLSVSTFELIDYDSKYNSQSMAKIAAVSLTYVDELKNLNNNKITMIGMLISIKDVPTAKGHMNFGTWIDEKGDYFDTTHFPDALQRFPFSGAGCYVLYGKVTVDFHFPTLEIIKMKKLPIKADPRYEDPGLQSQLPTTRELQGGKLPRAPYPSGGQVGKLFGRAEQPNPLAKKPDNNLPP